MEKKCKKGYSCGASCISTRKACRKEFPDGISLSLDTRSVMLAYPIRVQEKVDVKELSARLDELTYERVKEKVEDDIRALFEKEPLMKIVWGQASLFTDVENPLPSFMKLSDKKAVLAPLKEILSNPEDYSTNFPPEEARRLLAKVEELTSPTYDRNKDLREELGKLDPETRDELGRFRAQNRWAEPDTQKTKVTKLKELGGLSNDEAIGIAAWISFDDYRPLNKVIYNPESMNPLEQLEARWANDQIAKAVAKLPKTDREVMEVLKPASNNGRWTPRGEYLRALEFDNPAELEAFVAPYIAAVGSTIQEQTHFAATGFSNHNFIVQGNLIYKVRAKDDGTGNSVTLDEYKNYAYEAEVFWAAGQNFKVLGVKKTSKGYEVELEEEV